VIVANRRMAGPNEGINVGGKQGVNGAEPSRHSPYLFNDDLAPLAAPKGRVSSLKSEKRRGLLQAVDNASLNDAQREMVCHASGPIAGISIPGSGKTRVVTHRIARLIACGVKPKRILAVTFTKKAAREMKERVRGLISDYTSGRPTVCTLHGLGFKILQDGREHLNYRREVRVISEIHQEKLLERGLEHVDAQGKRDLGSDPVAGLREKISGWKNEGLDPQSVLDRGLPYGVAYKTYQQWLVRTGFADLDDLIRLPVALFTRTQAGPGLLATWQQEFDYIMVDEYQDTNRAQEDLLCLLAQEHRNLCVVGDDDQSIYGWRGADVTFIRSFSERWSGTRVVNLELNYRSRPEILRAAQRLIEAETEDRHPKKLVPFRMSCGTTPSVHAFRDEVEEAKWLAAHIHDQIQRGERTPGDFAVLVRDQYRSKVDRFEEALEQLKIPYESWFNDDLTMGPTKRNAYSLLSALHAPDHEDPSFLQLLESSRYRLPAEDFEVLIQIRSGQGLSLWQLIKEPRRESLTESGFDTLREFSAVVESLHTRATISRRKETLSAIAQDGFKALFPHATQDELWKDPRGDNEDTLALRRIVRNIDRFESKVKPRYRTFASYVHWQLVEIPRRIKEGEAKKKGETGRKAVVLTTMHGAKGLEFPVVYLPSFVEGVIPHDRCMEQAREWEGEDPERFEAEERRLAYVAVTRAMDSLHISFAREMRRRRRVEPQVESRYIRDMRLLVTE
jgi:DNA helicase-2/ATP-dependent DNA helicase PcrA